MNGAIRLITPIVKAAPGGDKRILRGIASTIDVDRMGDIVMPRGARYSLPLPLLLQHDHSSPVGKVIEATITDSEIRITAEVAKGIGKCDEAWDLVCAGLTPGLSIGFIGLKSEPVGKRGLRWIEWGWHETSIVTIAANAAARIVNATGKGAVQLTAATPHRHGAVPLLLRAR